MMTDVHVHSETVNAGQLIRVSSHMVTGGCV